MFHYLSTVPFLRLVLAFALGIKFCDYFYTAYTAPWLCLCAILLSVLLLKEFFYRHTWSFTEWLWLPLFFSAGLVYTSFSYIRVQYGLSVPETDAVYIIQVNGPPVPRGKVLRVPGTIYGTGSSPLRPGQGYFYFHRAENDSLPLLEGDLLQVYFRPALFEEPLNQAGFNLRKYYGRKGIVYTGFVNRDSWKKAGHRRSFLPALRRTLVNRVRGAFNDREEADVAAALVFGYEDDIDDATRDAFRKSGITHVLAVSGLHVSIIWWLLSVFFFFLKGKKSLELLRMLLILAGLWIYAAITGFAPSILRATVMFSFLMWASVRNKGYNSWNILFVSAFFILLLSPAYFFDAGFWLSYLAVGGIMYFVPRWQRYTVLLHPVLRLLCDLLAVTIAAQLSTVFYSLYVFGTFPNWFLLNNMVAVPLSSLALFAGLAYCLLAEVPYLSEMSALLFELSTRLMIESARFFEKLPGSYSANISFGLAECILCYAGVLATALFGQRRRQVFLYAAFLAGCLLLLSLSLRMALARRQHMLVMYSVRNGAYVEYIFGRSSFVLYRYRVSGAALGFAAGPFHRRYLLAESRQVPLAYHAYTLYGFRMLFIGDQNVGDISAGRYDVWHICGRRLPHGALRQCLYKPRLLVIHGSAGDRACRYWKTEAARYGIPVYTLTEQGMYIWQIP